MFSFLPPEPVTNREFKEVCTESLCLCTITPLISYKVETLILSLEQPRSNTVFLWKRK